MPRFFVGADQISDKDIVITGTDVNHIRNVLRMTPGEEVTVSDGQGMDYFCRIAELTKEEVRLDIVDSWHSFVELPAKIYLFQGLPKADKMELIIQKAVELGVHTIVPVSTDRTVVKLDAKKETNKRKRWMSISESAAKQSGRLRIPEVTPVVSYREALEMAKKMDVRLIPYELAEGMEKTRELMSSIQPGQSVAVFIGPEGGFESSEIEKAMEIGAWPITLGKRILRTETAGLVTLAMLVYNLER